MIMKNVLTDMNSRVIITPIFPNAKNKEVNRTQRDLNEEHILTNTHGRIDKQTDNTQL